MDYFVNAENHPCYHWQLELLIESFKQNDCEKDLFVFLTENNIGNLHNPHLCFNLFKHERTNTYQNIGKIKGYSRLNRLYGLYWASLAGKIQQPFFVLPTDVVLRHPLEILLSKTYAELVFYPDPFFTIDLAVNNVGTFWQWTGKTRDFYEKKWIPINELMGFANMPTEFFNLVIKRAELLAVQQLLNNQEIWVHTDRLAFSTVIAEYLENISCKGDYSLVSPVLGGDDSSFISYQDGIPPDFHKSMFTYPEPTYGSLGDPIAILSELFPSPNALFISNLAKKSLKSRSK